MLRCFLLVATLMCSVTALAKDPVAGLPTPHYRPQASDPEWLKVVVQFHGHLGPAVVAGARVGMAGLRAVDAKGYFDIDVTCEGPMAKPPQSCFLDGLQIATGATLGKRSLHWIEAAQVKVRFKNTTTGQTAELSPTPALLDLVPALARKPNSETARDDGADKHATEDRLESIARQIGAMPERELVTATADTTPPQ
jgi:formylmethanofuran dehydrogenase subunit E